VSFERPLHVGQLGGEALDQPEIERCAVDSEIDPLAATLGSAGEESDRQVALGADPLCGVLLQPGIEGDAGSGVADGAAEPFVLELAETAFRDRELRLHFRCVLRSGNGCRRVQLSGELRRPQQQRVDARQIDPVQGEVERVAGTSERAVGGDLLRTVHQPEVLDRHRILRVVDCRGRARRDVPLLSGGLEPEAIEVNLLTLGTERHRSGRSQLAIRLLGDCVERDLLVAVSGLRAQLVEVLAGDRDEGGVRAGFHLRAVEGEIRNLDGEVRRNRQRAVLLILHAVADQRALRLQR
jgi:hypothetical protein